jgi:alpha-1,3-glucosyltransferase
MISTGMTLLASLPSCIILFKHPSGRNFVFSQISVSLAFFLFSFHVHEKQIILPLLFLGLLFEDFKHYFSMIVFVSNFSMYRLYIEEKNMIAYYSMTLGYLVFSKQIESYALNQYRL